MNFIRQPRPTTTASTNQPAPLASASAATAAATGDGFLNLIFFGETGVGKSSLINTAANFMSFDTFDMAELNGPKCVIPCQFTMTDQNYNVKTIEVGDQSCKAASAFVAGNAVTQNAASYEFAMNINGQQRKVRIIDTPGVGDPRGFEQDRANIKGVIEYLKNFDGLNAICVLLMPNASRFTLQFRYCFKELLVNLSRGTAPNICFLYTNSRGTFFRPGECHPMLLQELERIANEDNVQIPRQNNFFCFDSEVFRYLAARNEINFEKQEVDVFRSSWEKGNESLIKLIAHAANLKQAAVRPIYLLSSARRVLLELAKPVAEISRNIQINKKLAQDKRDELSQLDLNSNATLNLYIYQTDLELEALPMPQTVCGDPACTRVFNTNGVQTIKYVTKCHDPCYLEDVDRDVVGHSAIKKCHAFDCGDLDDCNECGHNWQKHLHKWTEVNEIQVQVIDPNVQSLIDQNASKVDQLNAAIESTEKLVQQLEDEQALLVRSCAKLAKYIKRNCILYYNPDLEEYLNLLIQEEQQKKAAGGTNDAVIDGLRQVKANFLAEVDILKNSQQAGLDEIATEADIFNLMDTLANMPLNGNTLATMLHTPMPQKP